MSVHGPPLDNYFDTGQNIVELNGLLYNASEELKEVSSNLQSQRQFYEANLCELQDLLKTAIRERDEAREQLNNLKQILGEHSCQILKPSTTSQGRIKWADNPQAGNPTYRLPVIDEHQWDLPDLQNRLEFPTNEPENCRKSEDQPVECLNLAEKQALYNQQHRQHEKNVVFQDQHPEATEGQQPSESPILRLVEEPITGQDLWQQRSDTSKPIGISDTVPDPSCFMGYPQNCKQETEMGLISLPPSPMPLHLPAPPEADMQVILNTLPEKGKLLQAVIQAGPLLQSLLISGSLPRWRHPPPSLDEVETPILCVDSMPNPFDHMQVHAANRQDLYFPASNFHQSPNLVACTRNPTDFQQPVMYQAGSSSPHTSSSSAKFKPIFTAMPPDYVMKGRTKVTKFRPTKHSYQNSHHTL